MGNKRKLVVFKSQSALLSRAGNYPCLVNYCPTTLTGVFDDGVGHTSDVTFAVAATILDLKSIALAEYDIIELSDAQTLSDLF